MAAAPPPPSYDHWQWLNKTYWYVPNQYLLAIISDPSLPPIPVADQTVYYISNYQGGYFWGTTAVSFTQPDSSPSSTSCFQLVGSVTPQGAVHLTFTSLSSAPTTTTAPLLDSSTTGIGTMIPQPGGYAMENQMSTVAVGDVLVTHWAYMYQCKPSEPCFSSLPQVGSSIPAFLEPCLSPP